jgi:hemolysin activation/secretion protein
MNTDMRLALYGVNSSSNIAYAGSQAIIGAGSIFGARLVKPFTALNNYSHSATFGVDYKDFKESINLLATTNSKIETPITYLPLLSQYSGSVRRETSFTSFDLGLHFSVRDLGNSQAQFENKRYKASASYFYITGDLRDQHDLPYGMELKSHFSGQVADTPLISNEQYSMGGALNVRGYYETQALADSGAFGSFELYSPNLIQLDSEYLNNFKLFTFIDAANGWIQSPLGGQKSQYHLAGTGAGFNFHIKKYLLAALDVGLPLITLGPVKTGDPRIDFNVATEF